MVHTGVGVHAGIPARVVVGPTDWGRGIVFHTPRGVVPARLEHAHAVPGATRLARGEAEVHTPEHLLAALRGVGVHDAEVCMTGGVEVPILDGSAAAWLEGLRVERGPELGLLEVEPLDHEAGRVVVAPGAPELSVDVDFPDGPRGTARWRPDPDTFAAEVAWARTFVLPEQVEAMSAAGRGRGATTENTLVWGRGRARRPDEPVVHKLLDLLGDLALLPPLRARVHVVKGSHTLHLAALRRVVVREP